GGRRAEEIDLRERSLMLNDLCRFAGDVGERLDVAAQVRRVVYPRPAVVDEKVGLTRTSPVAPHFPAENVGEGLECRLLRVGPGGVPEPQFLAGRPRTLLPANDEGIEDNRLQVLGQGRPVRKLPTPMPGRGVPGSLSGPQFLRLLKKR